MAYSNTVSMDLELVMDLKEGIQKKFDNINMKIKMAARAVRELSDRQAMRALMGLKMVSEVVDQGNDSDDSGAS